MIVRSDNAPSNAFSLERLPKKPGYSLVRFYENAKPFEEKDGDLTITGYEYDEYKLEMQTVSDLQGYVLSNYAALLAKAKLQETQEDELTPERRIADLEAENAALHGKVASLEGQVTDAQLALCDVYELMMGGEL